MYRAEIFEQFRKIPFLIGNFFIILKNILKFVNI